MKYKFKPQTGLIVGGMLAGAYASATCYWQSSVNCAPSGSEVDIVYFDTGNGTGGIQYTIYSSADWVIDSLALSGGGGGYST